MCTCLSDICDKKPAHGCIYIKVLEEVWLTSHYWLIFMGSCVTKATITDPGTNDCCSSCHATLLLTTQCKTLTYMVWIRKQWLKWAVKLQHLLGKVWKVLTNQATSRTHIATLTDIWWMNDDAMWMPLTKSQLWRSQDRFETEKLGKAAGSFNGTISTVTYVGNDYGNSLISATEGTMSD